MARKTVVECDRCGGTGKGILIVVESKTVDLCSACAKALKSWLSRDNATTPGGHGPGWREVCTHFVPCGGPCGSPKYERV